MKLFYGDIELGSVMTNHSMSIEDMLDMLDINMDEYAEKHGWDDWEYDHLRLEVE